MNTKNTPTNTPMKPTIITAAEAKEITLRKALTTIDSHIKNAATNGGFTIKYDFTIEELSFYKEISDILTNDYGYQVTIIPSESVLYLYHFIIKW